ncbi:MAG: 50S ribosome-binding protein YggL, partial [Polyangiales bacterium]
LDRAAFEAFLDRLVDFVESRGLGFGGGPVDGHFRGFVSRYGRGSATDDDRAAFTAFLEGDPAIARHDVHALRDAWHGHD